LFHPLRRILDNRACQRVIGSVQGARTNDPVFSLTFDDGPDPRVTPGVLALLAQRDATATFFMRADRALAHPELARAVAARGHEIGLHGFSHQRLTEIGVRGFRHETADARRELERVVGVRPRWFRPPFGAQNLRTFLAVRGQGMDVAVWSTSVRDARRTQGVECEQGPAGSLTLRAAGQEMVFSAGNVLLLHDTPAHEDPPDAAERKLTLIESIVDAVYGTGGKVVTLSELLRHGSADRRLWRSAGY
jgi:peptidoglycan/xylan/chitin deacetylase (PgdA/CDA1 family)